MQKLYKKEEELMLESNWTYGKEGTKPLWNYFRGFLGYKTKRVTYEQDRQIRNFSATAEMIMQWRLCDIITWVFCPDQTGLVPTHLRRPYKAPGKSVSPHGINNHPNPGTDFP